MDNIDDALPNETNEELPTFDIQKVDFSQIIDKINTVKAECAKLLVGQNDLIELLFTSLLCGGHVLIEGVPGIAKTLSAKTLSKTINADFSRIQFTPDLMPADIIGTSIFNMKTSDFTFKKGPIFSNIILIDEINRAPAKTQAALFEVMEERQISYDGITYKFDFPFFIIATQNPIEQEGTYRLPEAQLDRFFMKIIVDYPSFDEEVKILEKFKNDQSGPDLNVVNQIISPTELLEIQELLSQIHIEPQIIDYIARLVQETRSYDKIYLGASPRASLAILKAAKVTALLANRVFIIPDDVQYVSPFILNHRIILTPEAEMAGFTTLRVISDILKEVEVPR